MAITLDIKGMTCNHCVQAVTRALQAVPGVRTAVVSLDRGQACVDGGAADALLRAIEDQGYTAAAAEAQ